MKKQLLFALLLTSFLSSAYAQTGSITGNVKDEKTGEALIGASVYVKGTTLGTVTDFDGNYNLQNIPVGTLTITCSFISFETCSKEHVTIVEEKPAVVNFIMSESVLALEDVKVVAKANRESEIVLLLDQKKTLGITQSIGAQELAIQGISDAATAAAKISGVSQSEASGDVYVRGLGDRYLSTSMNGLPIPSDDVEKKNIDLKLFGADMIKNLSIHKTYLVGEYGDQASGNVNIASKSFSSGISLSLSAKMNTNLLKDRIFSNFKTSQNYNNVNFGFYKKTFAIEDAVRKQSWNPDWKRFPIGYNFSILAGKKTKIRDKDLSIFATLSHENESSYQEGIYLNYRMNSLNQSFNDTRQYTSKISTTALLNLSLGFNSNHRINFNSLYIHKAQDELYEQGRNGEGFVRDQDPAQEGAFVRDQNLETTSLLTNQLLGSHKAGDKNQLNWAISYNKLNAEEPNRIRNEVNILDANTVQFAHVGDYQQRKSEQYIEDVEVNGYVKNELKWIDFEDKKLKLNFGGNFRMRERNFNSLFVGIRAKGTQFQVSSVDDLDQGLLHAPFYGNSANDLRIRVGTPDFYLADLHVYAAYLNAGFQLNKLSGSFGLRYEKNQIEVDWDVANYNNPVTGTPRKGSISKNYSHTLPAIQLKYQLTDKTALRFAASKTIGLPEFKELSPFEYVSPTGRVTKGNPDLKNSDISNFDFKWEISPTAKQLVSVTAFCKMIHNPINLALTRGSSGYFYYANTGDKADVYGLEFETRLALLKAESLEMPELNVIVNATKMWFNQDLLEEFQYKNKTKSALQGASDFIVNGNLNFSNNKKKEFNAALIGNYSSDKIFALGSPESYESSTRLFNHEIIEKAFVSLDVVLRKKISDRISLKLTGKNLLNPSIEQTQNIEATQTKISKEIVSAYKKGVKLSLGIKVNLNKP